jgi:hypothetical protein
MPDMTDITVHNRQGQSSPFVTTFMEKLHQRRTLQTLYSFANIMRLSLDRRAEAYYSKNEAYRD